MKVVCAPKNFNFPNDADLSYVLFDRSSDPSKGEAGATLPKDLKKQGITDRSIIQNTMDQFEKEENQKLSQILTKDQMDKWVAYKNYQKMLNQDQVNDTQNQMGQGYRHGRHGGMSQSAAFGM